MGQWLVRRLARARAALAEAVGADTEDLVVRYHRLAWTTDTIAGLRARLDALSGAERAVTLMRLANDVDDHLDLGVLYCADAERRLREMRARRVPCVAMAEALGGPELRDALAAAYADVERADLPAMLRRTDGSSYRLPPASHQTRPRVALSHLLAWRPWRSRRRGRPENPRESEDT